MRVLMLGWEFPPCVTGGLGVACRGITEGLASHDVRVLFVVPRSGGAPERHGARVIGCDQLVGASATAVEARPTGRGKLDVLGVSSPLRPYMGAGEYARESSWEDTGGFQGGYGPSLFAEVERYADVVSELALGETFDLIHAHDWMTFPAAQRIRERTGKPLVCHVHACERDRSDSFPDERILELERAGFAGADLVVCVSRYTATRVHAEYGIPREKLRVVHNAIDPRSTNGTAPRYRGERGPLVLFLGRVTAQKGPRYFLEAASRIVAEDPSVRFVMGGTGDQLPAMVEHAAELGLGRNVHFTGYLSDEQVDEIYAETDVFVLSSVSEPFGLTPLEALSRKVPVVISRQSGVAEVLSSCPKYDYWDTEDLADKVLTLLRSPALRRQLAEAGQLELENLRWERRAAALLEVYRELV